MVCCRCRWETSYQKGAVYEFEPDYRGIVCAECALVLRMHREEAVPQEKETISMSGAAIVL